MELFIFWVAFSLIPAVVAAKRGRSGVGWFFLGLLISPLIATIVVVAIEDLSKKRCDACGQQVPVAAHICPFCKKDFSEKRPFVSPRQPATDGGVATVSAMQEFTPDNLTKKCPDCAENIKLEALVCRFCSHKFEPAEVSGGDPRSEIQV